jgi:hypothetical protein
MGRLRKLGLWTLVVAGLLQASGFGLVWGLSWLPGDQVPWQNVGVLLVGSGLVLVPVGGLLAVIGWAFGPGAGGVKPALGGSLATLAGIGIGAALGSAVGMAPIILWGLLVEPAHAQGALLKEREGRVVVLAFVMGAVGVALGGAVGALLGARARRREIGERTERRLSCGPS